MSKKPSKVTLHLPTLISKDMLHEHPSNSNKQDTHTFAELRKSIRKNGFDESLTVVPRPGEEGYWIVSGNHRFRAGSKEGMKDFPCVIREDWDNVSQQVELVRRNYVRGEIDQEAFTQAVDSLTATGISQADIKDLMGFQEEDFSALYLQHLAEEDAFIAAAVEEHAKKVASPVTRMVDDIQLVVSSILEQYGDTVPHSFLVFPLGGKEHVYIAASPGLQKTMKEIGLYAVKNGLDINVVVAGLLAIGKANSSVGDQLKQKVETATLED